MKRTAICIFINFILITFSPAQGDNLRKPITVEEIKITTVAGASREIAYTNKQAGVYYTETNGAHRSAWQGWRIMSQELLEDYLVRVDGKPLHKQDAIAEVFPHQLIREYSTSTRETVTLLDSIDAIVIQLEQLKGKELTFYPYFTDLVSQEQCQVSFEQGILLIAKQRHLERTAKENYPVWIGIATGNSEINKQTETIGNTFSPAGITSEIENSQSTIVMVAGDTKEQTIRLAQQILLNYPSFISKRKERMENLLNGSYLRTSNTQFDAAMHWAKLSADALIMNQGKKGIFAGLPWFDNYWGRDTYISLPGATLVIGNFSDAKDILTSFSEWQDTNTKSSTYGRIPNIVTTSSIAYNTADGTPRFIQALYDYYKYSLDTSFLRSMYPVVKRSIEGTLLYHSDSLYFLTHADAETWMDAVGPDGAWSPRGNRANDIQVLWSKQLSVGYRLAEFTGDKESMNRWGRILVTLQKNFEKHFFDSTNEFIYDHLKIDGTPDKQLRPNIIFTYPMFLQKSKFIKPFTELTHNLVFRYGVASLSPQDDNFHPYHHYEPYYVQDAAYHNGIVWTWLAGPWIDLATEFGKQNFAFELTSDMTEQILSRGAVGTMSELLDALPRKEEDYPRLSGTYSQAWSLAEFIRNGYQSYLGVGVNSNIFKTSDNIAHLAKNPHILLIPRLPDSLSSADFFVLIESDTVEITYEKTAERFDVTIAQQSIIENLKVEFVVPPEFFSSDSVEATSLPIYRFNVPSSNKALFTFSKKLVTLNGRKINPYGTIPIQPLSLFADLQYAEPMLRPDLKSLKGPEHIMLSNNDVKQVNSQSTILADISDPEMDDTGSTGYTYPQTTHLQSGSLDITHFTMRSDESNVYFTLKFKNLSNPGWHPEYGFQLTYIAIAIDTDGVKNSGGTEPGMNSNYTFDGSFAFEHVIFVGGGIRLVDAKRKTIAEYLPASGDEKTPLGNATTKTIEFALPQKLLGTPSNNWQIAVLVGCQDDHGGAGVGEFRTIDARAGEWIGGGKTNPSAPNIYDEILPGK